MDVQTDIPGDFELWPTDRRKAWQLSALPEVLDYAYEQSELYRDLWSKCGINHRLITNFDEFRLLPIVNKSDVIKSSSRASRIASARVGFSTRGTSGNPLVVWLDEKEARRYLIPTARGFRWAGLREKDRALILSPSWHRLAAMEGHAVIQANALPNYFWGSLSDASHVAPFVDALLEVRPHFVTSTPPFILSVLRHCEDRGIAPSDVFSSVRSIVLVGLALTPGLRKQLLDRLNVDGVFERGGTQEGAALDECHLHTGMHVHEDVCYLEVVDQTDTVVMPGTAGRLVITKLVAGGSPFVRYDTGDTAYFQEGECPCGIKMAQLRIVGRPENTLLVKGIPITGYDVRRILDDQPDFVGRVSLLVNDPSNPNRLRILMEGEASEVDPGELLAESLGIDDVMIDWGGGANLAWGFRQIIDVRELTKRKK